MKFQRYLTYISVLLIISTELCSSTFLAGAMFYYLMGSYFTREIVPNVVSSALKGFTPQTQSNVAYSGGSATDTVAEMIKIGKVLGINRRLDSYMKELWPIPEDCSVKPCAKPKQSRKKKSDVESEEDDSEEKGESSNPNHEITASEELEGFIIKDDEDADILADEELVDDDPFNFYYIMKEDHKKQKLKKQKSLQEWDSDNSNGDPGHRNRPNSPPPPHVRRGLFNFPIFFRRQVPNPPIVNYAHPPAAGRDPRGWNPFSRLFNTNKQNPYPTHRL